MKRTSHKKHSSPRSLPAPISQHICGAKPKFLPPQQAVNALSIGRDEVFAALTRGGYLLGGKTTDKLTKSRVVAFCDRQVLWDMAELLQIVRANSYVEVERAVLNQSLPANVKPGVFTAPHRIAAFFNVSPAVFRTRLVDGGWWFHTDRDQPVGSKERRFGKPRQWVIDRGYAKRASVKNADGSISRIWVVDAWHVMRTFSGQVASPVPEDVVKPLDIRVEPPKPKVSDYVDVMSRRLREAHSYNHRREMLSLVKSTKSLGYEYVSALEVACGLPRDTFTDPKWAYKVPAGALS